MLNVFAPILFRRKFEEEKLAHNDVIRKNARSYVREFRLHQMLGDLHESIEILRNDNRILKKRLLEDTEPTNSPKKQAKPMAIVSPMSPKPATITEAENTATA